MQKWLRFSDLKARGLVNSWPALANKIRTQGFPPGRMLGPNTRAWTRDEIEVFEESRPIASAPPRGAAKVAKGRAPRDRRRKAADEAAPATT
jgi:hypothetical protein